MEHVDIVVHDLVATMAFFVGEPTVRFLIRALESKAARPSAQPFRRRYRFAI